MAVCIGICMWCKLSCLSITITLAREGQTHWQSLRSQSHLWIWELWTSHSSHIFIQEQILNDLPIKNTVYLQKYTKYEKILQKHTISDIFTQGQTFLVYNKHSLYNCNAPWPLHSVYDFMINNFHLNTLTEFQKGLLSSMEMVHILSWLSWLYIIFLIMIMVL